MVLKRKRSESELSFSSTLSSPPRPDIVAFTFSAAVPENWSQWLSRPSTPSHLPSRTMKRFRDNRPTENEVHQRTLNLLYSARYSHGTAIRPEPDLAMSEAPSTEVLTRRNGQQRSLHSFWKLPGATGASMLPTTATTLSSPPPQQELPTCCEDCGAELADSLDMLGDAEGLGPSSQSCEACRKAVCYSCSVSSLGEHRRCLVCAS
ncbi:hypothetical protein QBC47DRAFT_43495 [Echria macrotheca]|uniref:Uncharacterized protein n=1 Tax=Echria macrotheca TaxID=438768 RepID=A0AAJ0B846_9PEZI|nr:hypothetical protein QBC47DRAFT_43495 [Echria macrotheca]